MVESFRDLRVWQTGMELVTECYRLTRRFPSDERFGLASQVQRAAVSVPANIAEGHGRGTTNAYVNHLWIANGSLTELETHLLIAQRLGYVTEDDLARVLDLIRQVGRMLIALRRSLEIRSS
ncbi:MAG TPA: four helix bundle protein [Planctomycetaceae bacterium]